MLLGAAREVAAQNVGTVAGAIKDAQGLAVPGTTVRYCPWGQVIYDHNRRSALDRVNRFLDGFGIIRAGRYSQWGYMMTHDCVLRGKKIAEHLGNRKEELTEFEIDD